MLNSTHKTHASSTQTQLLLTPAAHAAIATPELIDPRWILKALAIILAVALLCAWGTLCLLWYQGQWQLVLHPSRNVATTPNPFRSRAAIRRIRFFDDATGQPQLPAGSSLTGRAVLQGLKC